MLTYEGSPTKYYTLHKIYTTFHLMYSRYNGYQYENQEKLKRYCFIKCLYTSLHIQVHLAGALQKSDILKYM